MGRKVRKKQGKVYVRIMQEPLGLVTAGIVSTWGQRGSGEGLLTAIGRRWLSVERNPRGTLAFGRERS